MARHAGVGDKQTNRAYCQNSVQQRSAQNGSNLSTDKLGLFCALFFILRRYELETSLNVAEALAADLAGAGVDPNEAQKALAYLRSKRDGKALFDYLQSVVTNGGVVIRSGRTLGYYRDLQRACQRHLRPLQNDYEQMVLAFGWSLRLLRYYRVVPEAAKEKAEQQRQQNQEPRPSRPVTQRDSASSTRTVSAHVPNVDQDKSTPTLPSAKPLEEVRLKGTVKRKSSDAYTVAIKESDVHRLPITVSQRSYEIRLPVSEAPNIGKNGPTPMCIVDRVDDDEEVIWLRRAPQKQ